jgi:hypothetical protein
VGASALDGPRGSRLRTVLADDAGPMTHTQLDGQFCRDLVLSPLQAVGADLANQLGVLVGVGGRPDRRDRHRHQPHHGR